MNEEGNKILGSIELGTGEKKPIILLNDVFLNYTFNEKEYWETLREMVNIFYDAYKGYHEPTKIEPIEGKISVITQFPYYRYPDSTTPKRQDAKIISDSKCDYIEFQNDVSSAKIIMRSIDYFGFSLTRGKGKSVNNIWLLNGTVTELLKGNTFSNYILMDEVNHQPHPNTANILYVNLKQLAKDDSRAGELAGMMIGEVKEPKDSDIDRIFQSFKDSFENFKDKMEVCDILTRVEELKAEGRVEGRSEVLPLIAEKDKQLAEQAEQLAEQAEQLAEQAERIRKLEAQIDGNLS